MKALTVHQPWAHLILTGEKRVENRSWSTSYRGPLAIHAGARCGAERQGWLTEGQLEQLREAGYPIPEIGDLPFSAIVGVVELVDVIRYDQARLPGFDHLQEDPFATGPYCWILANPRPLERPIPHRGERGLWDLPDDVLPPGP